MDESDKLPTSDDDSNKNSDEAKSDSTDDDTSSTTPHEPYQILFSDDPDYYWVKDECGSDEEKARSETNEVPLSTPQHSPEPGDKLAPWIDPMDVQPLSTDSAVPDLVSFSDKNDYCNRLKDEDEDEAVFAEEKAKCETNDVSLSDTMDVHSLSAASDAPDLISFSDEPDRCNRLTDVFAEGNETNEVSFSDNTDVHSLPSASDVPDLKSYSNENGYCYRMKDEDLFAEEKTNDVPLSDSRDVHSLPSVSDVPDLIFSNEIDHCSRMEKAVFAKENARNETNEDPLTDKMDNHSLSPASDASDLISLTDAHEYYNWLKDEDVLLSDTMNVHSLSPGSDVPDLISFSDEPDQCNRLKDEDIFTEGTTRNQTKSLSSTEKCFQLICSDDKLLPSAADANQDTSTSNEEKYLDKSKCNRLLKLESEDSYSKPFVSDTYSKVSLPEETPSTSTLQDQSLCLRQAPVNGIIESTSPEISSSICADSESPNPETAYPGKKKNKDSTGSLSRTFRDCNSRSDLIHCSDKEKLPICKRDPEVSENITSGRQSKLKSLLSPSVEEASAGLQLLKDMVSDYKSRYGSSESDASIEGETENSLKGNFPKTLPIGIESSNSVASKELETPSDLSGERCSDSNSFENYSNDDDIHHFVEKEELADQKAKEESDSVSQVFHLPLDENGENQIPTSGSIENLANSSETSKGNSSPLQERNPFEGYENKLQSTSDIEEEMMGDETTLSDRGSECEDGDTTEQQLISLQSNDFDAFRFSAVALLYSIPVRSSVSRKYGKQTWASRRKWHESIQTCIRKRGCKRRLYFLRSIISIDEYEQMMPNGTNFDCRNIESE